MESLFS
ncbi:unnamed protein product [Callosobruchus maculatus]|nr:unnamed protein product [Callosobruchus maculatus]